MPLVAAYIESPRVVSPVVQDMSEYVYALFDFVPENPDEIHFKAGERIEVVEKDDVYSDGWWQVRVLFDRRSVPVR